MIKKEQYEQAVNRIKQIRDLWGFNIKWHHQLELSELDATVMMYNLQQKRQLVS